MANDPILLQRQAGQGAGLGIHQAQDLPAHLPGHHGAEAPQPDGGPDQALHRTLRQLLGQPGGGIQGLHLGLLLAVEVVPQEPAPTALADLLHRGPGEVAAPVEAVEEAMAHGAGRLRLVAPAGLGQGLPKQRASARGSPAGGPGGSR